MKIRGIALRTIEEQLAGGDHDVIDPKAIENLPATVPLSISFGNKIGTATVSLVDGRLVVEADIPDDCILANKLAVGVSSTLQDKKITTPHRLYEISLTHSNKDSGIPPYGVVEE